MAPAIECKSKISSGIAIGFPSNADWKWNLLVPSLIQEPLYCVTNDPGDRNVALHCHFVQACVLFFG